MTYRVIFDPNARTDFDTIFAWIADHSGEAAAERFSSRLEQYCMNLATFPYRGTARDDFRPGVRVLGFRKQATIVFTVGAESVTILRILYRGRNLEAALDEP